MLLWFMVHQTARSLEYLSWAPPTLSERTREHTAIGLGPGLGYNQPRLSVVLCGPRETILYSLSTYGPPIYRFRCSQWLSSRCSGAILSEGQWALACGVGICTFSYTTRFRISLVTKPSCTSVLFMLTPTSKLPRFTLLILTHWVWFSHIHDTPPTHPVRNSENKKTKSLNKN